MSVKGELISMTEYITDILSHTSTHAIQIEDQENTLEINVKEFDELVLDSRPGRKNQSYAR